MVIRIIKFNNKHWVHLEINNQGFSINPGFFSVIDAEGFKAMFEKAMETYKEEIIKEER